MTVGTKSLLFGVHQFLWHPWTVARAWRRLYGVWPNRYEWLAIACHDLGYFGCPDLDGAAGKRHPYFGANLAGRLAKWLTRGTEFERVRVAWDIYILAVAHSQHTAAALGMPPSALCWADKFSIFFEPRWFYLLRARLSGEIVEYRMRAAESRHVPANAPHRIWFEWYRGKVWGQCRKALGW